jgi:hypothetical protein
MEKLILIATFEVLPMDDIYELVPIFDFEVTGTATLRTNMERIKIEDRSFVNSMGSMFVFMMIFLM